MVNKFKTKIEVNKYLSGEFLTCLICHDQFKSLGSHLIRKHDVRVDEYKIIYGLPHSRGLVAEKTSKLMAENLAWRRETGDKTMVLLPSTADKAHRAAKHKPVAYNRGRITNLGFLEAQKRKKESLDRINAIDWDDYLDTVRLVGKAAWFLSSIPGMPSVYDVQRKQRMDAIFKDKYQKLKQHHLPKYKYPERVKRLRSDGLTLDAIADCLGIGRSTVKRIVYGNR